MCMMEQHRVMDDPKRPPLPDPQECGTIKEVLKKEIATLTDQQAEYVLRRLQCLLQSEN